MKNSFRAMSSLNEIKRIISEENSLFECREDNDYLRNYFEPTISATCGHE